jgi:hypothetical protein
MARTLLGLLIVFGLLGCGAGPAGTWAHQPGAVTATTLSLERGRPVVRLRGGLPPSESRANGDVERIWSRPVDPDWAVRRVAGTTALGLSFECAPEPEVLACNLSLGSLGLVQ